MCTGWDLWKSLAKLLYLWVAKGDFTCGFDGGDSRMSLCRKVSCPHFVCIEQLSLDNKGLTGTKGCDLPCKHAQRQYWGAYSWTMNIFSAFLHSSALLLHRQGLQSNFSSWSFWKCLYAGEDRWLAAQCFLSQSCWEFFSIALTTRKLWSYVFVVVVGFFCGFFF